VKLFAFLLSLFVVILTTVPCCAVEEGQAHHNEQKEKKCADKDDDCCKDCSPFYVCGTCVGFTISNHSPVTFVVYLRTIQHDSVYIPVKLSYITSSIWQPPKLS